MKIKFSLKSKCVQLLVRAFVLVLSLKKNYTSRKVTFATNPELRGDICIIAPHPDDEIIGCYHFIEHIGLHASIDLIYVTEENSSKMVLLRRAESAEATKVLTVRNRVWWHFPDGDLHSHRIDLRQRLSKIKNNYNLILCPAPNDETSDHIVLAEEAYNIISVERLLWYRSTWLTFPLVEADFVIEGKAQKKQMALHCFISQRKMALQNVISISALEAQHCGIKSNSVEGFRFASSGILDTKPLNTLSIMSFWRLRKWH